MDREKLLRASGYDQIARVLKYIKASFFKWDTLNKTITIDGWAAGVFNDDFLEEITVTIDEMLALIHPEDAVTIRDQIARLSKGSIGKIDYKCRIVTNTTSRWIRLIAEKSLVDNNSYGMVIDVTEEHLNQAVNFLNVNLYNATLELSNISGLYIPLVDGIRSVHFFASLFHSFDISQTKIKYKDKHHYTTIDIFKDILHPDDVHIFEELIRLSQVSTLQAYEETIRFRLKNKQYKWYKLVMSKRLTPYGEGLIGAIADVDESTHHVEDIHFQAHHDALTSAKNRNALREYKLDTSKPTAVILIDLDDFKDINDLYGHDAGDRVLMNVVEKLWLIYGNEFVYRLGGDEFVIIVENYDDRILRLILDKTLETLNEPIVHSVEKYHISASIGVSFNKSGEMGNNLSKLISEADYALYDAKRNGKNSVIITTESKKQEYLRRMHLEDNIRDALNNKEFKPLFLPIEDNLNNKVIGIEALAHWFHNGEDILASEFIRIARKHNLMYQLDLTIIEQSLDTLRHLIDKQLVDEDFKLFINLSSSSLKSMDPETLIYLVKLKNIKPSSIYFEINADFILDRHVMGACEELRNLGFKLVLDDYSTGTNALDYLVESHFDFVKVNQSVIPSFKDKKTTKDIKYEQLYFHLVSMLQFLGFEVICEGIETQEQYNALLTHGIRYIQGYALCNQLTSTEVSSYLENKKTKE